MIFSEEDIKAIASMNPVDALIQRIIPALADRIAKAEKRIEEFEKALAGKPKRKTKAKAEPAPAPAPAPAPDDITAEDVRQVHVMMDEFLAQFDAGYPCPFKSMSEFYIFAGKSLGMGTAKVQKIMNLSREELDTICKGTRA